MLHNLTKVLLAAALTVSSAAPALAASGHYPSDFVQGVTITSPANGATVPTTFTLSGTSRADLGCYVGFLQVEGKEGLVNPAGLKFSDEIGTWSWTIDATQPLIFDGGAEGDIIGTGKRRFFTSAEAPNCGPTEIVLNIVPKGGVATGQGGSDFNRYLNQLLGR